MENNILQGSFIRFITSLITTIRKFSIYPAKHPMVAEAIKNVYSSLNEILGKKEKLSFSLSPDNKILLEGSPVTDKAFGTVDELQTFLKKMEIENMTFSAGITEREVEEFIKILALEAEQIRKSGDINRVFTERNILHVKVEQFAYIKIKKDEQAVVVDAGLSGVDKLKAKIKEFAEAKDKDPAQIKSLEKELFELIGTDIKEKKKVTSETKTLLKKFILSSENKQDKLQTLRDALLGYGCPVEEVDKLVNKIQEEITEGPKVRAKPLSKADADKLKQENERLRAELTELKQHASGQEQELVKIKKQYERVTDEKERIDNIVRHMGDGLVVVDPGGKIMLMNAQAETLLGVTQKDIGQPIKGLVKDEHLLTLVKNIPQDKEGVVEKDIELFSQNETTKKIVRTSSAVIEDHYGNTVGMVTTLNDITKQRELEQLKSNFVSSVSHELRTPLVTIEKSVSMMLSKATGEINETQQQFLAIADRNLKRLGILINDLLDLAKLEAGKMRLEIRPASIEKTIVESVEALNIWAKTRTINLQKQVQENLPDIPIDPNRIIQVLNNLIGNAIKFTPQNGSITVSARLDQEKQVITVSVADTGIGIAKENLKNMFEKFYQTGERISNDVAGTGIGLAIAKEIIELHKGKIWVESEKERGTTFFFVLPVSRDDVQEKPEEPLPVVPA